MNLIRRLFFLVWYYRNPPWDTYQTPPELYNFIQQNPPGRALDLGCGTGTNVITLAKHGWTATGVDFIPKVIRAARKNAIKADVQANFFIDDVTKLNKIQGPFELLLDIGCYQSLDQAGMVSYRRNIQRLLIPGGAFLIYLFFQSNQTSFGSGVTENDLTPFLSFLDLVERQEGTERGLHQAAWLTYRKPLP